MLSKTKTLAIVILLAVVLTACIPLGPASTPEYSLIGTQGDFNAFVVVDKGFASDTTALRSIADELCEGHPICIVLFWDDRNKAATSLPMTDAQVNALVATYNRNENTNFTQLLVCTLGDCH